MVMRLAGFDCGTPCWLNGPAHMEMKLKDFRALVLPISLFFLSFRIPVLPPSPNFFCFCSLCFFLLVHLSFLYLFFSFSLRFLSLCIPVLSFSVNNLFLCFIFISVFFLVYPSSPFLALSSSLILIFIYPLSVCLIAILYLPFLFSIPAFLSSVCLHPVVYHFLPFFSVSSFFFLSFFYPLFVSVSLLYFLSVFSPFIFYPLLCAFILFSILFLYLSVN